MYTNINYGGLLDDTLSLSYVRLLSVLIELVNKQQIFKIIRIIGKNTITGLIEEKNFFDLVLSYYNWLPGLKISNGHELKKICVSLLEMVKVVKKCFID